ncbi:MAG: hypothetical protein AB7O39_15960 [Flavobacteriaceae bacterium]
MENRTTSEHRSTEAGRVEISGRKARQGEIILRTRTRKIVFIGGLVAIVLVVALLRILAG